MKYKFGLIIMTLIMCIKKNRLLQSRYEMEHVFFMTLFCIFILLFLMHLSFFQSFYFILISFFLSFYTFKMNYIDQSIFLNTTLNMGRL